MLQWITMVKISFLFQENFNGGVHITVKLQTTSLSQYYK